MSEWAGLGTSKNETFPKVQAPHEIQKYLNKNFQHTQFQRYSCLFTFLGKIKNGRRSSFLLFTITKRFFQLLKVHKSEIVVLFKIQKCNARSDICLDQPVIPDYSFFQVSCLLIYICKCKKNHKTFSYSLYLLFYEHLTNKKPFCNRKKKT